MSAAHVVKERPKKRARPEAAPADAKSPHPAKRERSTAVASPTASSTTTAPPAAPSSRAPTPSLPAHPCQNALLVVSTYHAVMAGLVYKKGKFFIKFSVKRHVGRVNGTAVTARYIASSGVDERVFLFTNKAEERLTAATRKKMREAGEPLAVKLADLGSIAPPAEVTAMVFADGSQHLLCGCADGQLLIYRCRDWTVGVTLTVHEKAVVGLAVHPGSHGSLAVTVGEDRAIAVLDLVKGKLLTKWKYNPNPKVKSDEAALPAASAPSPAAAQKRSVFAPVREEPVGVLFSPAGTRLAIFSRFSFVVYDAASMQPVCSFQCSSPQPPDEMHCCVFLSESLLLVGTEAGVLRMHVVDGTGEAPSHCTAPLAAVPVVYPEGVAAAATALLATPVRVETEARQKNPLRHVNRVKALQVDGSTVFSIDSSGVVIAWNASFATNNKEEAPVRLQYVTSANCQGRVTGMELYPL